MNLRSILNRPLSPEDQRRRIVVRTHHARPTPSAVWKELSAALEANHRVARERLLGKSRLIAVPFDRVFIYSNQQLDNLKQMMDEAHLLWDDILPGGVLKIGNGTGAGSGATSYFGHGVWIPEETGAHGNPREKLVGSFKVRKSSGTQGHEVKLSGQESRPAGWWEGQTGLAIATSGNAAPATLPAEIWEDLPPAVLFFGKLGDHRRPIFDVLPIAAGGEIMSDPWGPEVKGEFWVDPPGWWAQQAHWHTVMHGKSAVFQFNISTDRSPARLRHHRPDEPHLEVYGLRFPEPGLGGVRRAWVEIQLDGTLCCSSLEPRFAALVCDGIDEQYIRVFTRGDSQYAGWSTMGSGDRFVVGGDVTRDWAVAVHTGGKDEEEQGILVYYADHKPLGYLPLSNDASGARSWHLTEISSPDPDDFSLYWLDQAARVVVHEGGRRTSCGLAHHWLRPFDRLELRVSSNLIEVLADGARIAGGSAGRPFFLGPLQVRYHP